MKPTNGKLKKRAAIIIAVLALAVTAIGGTYAWQDYRQHKSNELSGTMPKYDVTLVEEFDEVPDWKVEDGQITKRISVTNLGIAKKNFGDVYVRIQLKEYMEIGSLTYELSPKRYMIDIEGEFIILTEQEAINATAQGGLYEGHTYAQLTDAVSGRTGWFIETRDGDPNGQMGKHLITKITIGTPEAVIKNGPQQQAADKNHHGRIEIIDGKSVIVTESDECHYAVHSWKPGSELE
ncbi:MAG: hypothetical protein FWE80_07655, partial [Oscillospiraceae bacterium]|nr:hypothetical protein [Oscillospiraceae bacterium]